MDVDGAFESINDKFLYLFLLTKERKERRNWKKWRLGGNEGIGENLL